MTLLMEKNKAGLLSAEKGCKQGWYVLGSRGFRLYYFASAAERKDQKNKKGQPLTVTKETVCSKRLKM